MRTKQGLAAARAKGKQVGRPKGSRDKERVLYPYRDQILEHLEIGLTLAAVMKIINSQLKEAIIYNSYRYFVHYDVGPLEVWQTRR